MRLSLEVNKQRNAIEDKDKEFLIFLFIESFYGRFGFHSTAVVFLIVLYRGFVDEEGLDLKQI